MLLNSPIGLALLFGCFTVEERDEKLAISVAPLTVRSQDSMERWRGWLSEVRHELRSTQRKHTWATKSRAVARRSSWRWVDIVMGGGGIPRWPHL